MGQTSLDPREVLERLRSEHRTLRWEPQLPSDALFRLQDRPMREEDSLRYLHHHWLLPDTYSPAQNGRGIKARMARRFGSLVFRAMKPYLHAEREVVANLVRISDSLAKRCDDLAQVVTARQISDAESQARLAALIYDNIAESSDDRHRARGL